MSGTGIVISRLDTARNITLSGGERMQIERTKNEALFEDFRYANSGSAKIVCLVASNPLLTLLAFLHTRVVVSEDDEASVTIPLILGPRCDFAAKKIGEATRPSTKSLAGYTARRAWRRSWLCRRTETPSWQKLELIPRWQNSLRVASH